MGEKGFSDIWERSEIKLEKININTHSLNYKILTPKTEIDEGKAYELEIKLVGKNKWRISKLNRKIETQN